MALSNGEKRWGLILVNLGTPEAPTPKAVRRYLAEFLSDTRVVEIPKPVWWLILHGIILQVRPAKSAHAYKSIWMEQGSPLMVHTRGLKDAMAEAMKVSHAGVVVDFAMRYGQPALADRIRALQAEGIERFIVLPLYPQYSAPSSGTVFDALAKMFARERSIPEVHFIRDYHDHPAYISAICDSIKAHWASHGRSKFLLMSFHGLPKRNCELGDPYHKQCVVSANLIAGQLELKDEEWQLVFQSRFGKQEWLKPYCVDTLQELPGRGVKELDVVCPGFAVDCLETLEEIAMTNRDIFMEAGGVSYQMIPALNDSEAHVKALLEILADRTAFP